VKAPLAATLALGLLVPAMPATATANAGRYEGDCFFDTNSQATVTGQGTYVGVLGVHTVTTDAYVPPLPALATVECVIEVNGVVQNATNRLTVTGYGTQTGAQYTTLTAEDTDIVHTCLTVHYLGLAGATDDVECDEATTLQFPPGWVLDTMDTVFDLVNAAGAVPDPVVCPLLAAHQGTYGPYTISPEGDVTGPDPADLWEGDAYWDCPPYVDPPPTAPARGATYCPYGHVTGTASYAPALAVDATTHAETFDLTLAGCTGTPEPGGDTTFHLSGTAVDACITTGLYPTAGTGSGTLTGSTPQGAATGTYAVSKHGARYLVRGRFTSGGLEHVVDLWLDQQVLCPPGGVASSGLAGDGAVLDVAP